MRTLTDEEIRKEYYHLVRSRQQTARVNLLTNKGPLALLLECHKVPKTCENFIELCEKGYYKGTKFHRLIPKFMVSKFFIELTTFRFKEEILRVREEVVNRTLGQSLKMNFILHFLT